MQIFSITNLIVLTLLGLAGFLEGTSDTSFVYQSAEEVFKQLCIDEYKAKLELDKYLGLDEEDDLLEKYNELTDSRILLGAKLGIHFCPPELVANIIINEDLQISRRLQRMWETYDAKCRSAIKNAVICSKIKEARQISSGEDLTKRLLKQEQLVCSNSQSANMARKKYAENHLILKPCDPELFKASKEAAEIEAQEWLRSHSKTLVDGVDTAEKTSTAAKESKKEKNSYRAKVSGLFGNCFGKPQTKE